MKFSFSKIWKYLFFISQNSTYTCPVPKLQEFKSFFSLYLGIRDLPITVVLSPIKKRKIFVKYLEATNRPECMSCYMQLWQKAIGLIQNCKNAIVFTTISEFSFMISEKIAKLVDSWLCKLLCRHAMLINFLPQKIGMCAPSMSTHVSEWWHR